MLTHIKASHEILYYIILYYIIIYYIIIYYIIISVILCYIILYIILYIAIQRGTNSVRINVSWFIKFTMPIICNIFILLTILLLLSIFIILLRFLSISCFLLFLPFISTFLLFFQPQISYFSNFHEHFLCIFYRNIGIRKFCLSSS